MILIAFLQAEMWGGVVSSRRCVKGEANMLKKSINSASVSPDSRKRNVKLECLSCRGLLPHPTAVWSLRLWTFFIIFASLSDYRVAMELLKRLPSGAGICFI